MCCAPDSQITNESIRQGLLAERLTLETGWDFSDHAIGLAAEEKAVADGVKKVWLSLPCTPWSLIQNLNNKRPTAVKKKEKGRRLSRKMLRICLPVLRAVTLGNGGDFYFEWPTGCQGWNVQELLDFRASIIKGGKQVYECRVDGCAYGMRSRHSGHHLRKRWTIWTSDQDMFTKLGRRCKRNHIHTVIQGCETSSSAFYPRQMARKVSEVWAAS